MASCSPSTPSCMPGKCVKGIGVNVFPYRSSILLKDEEVVAIVLPATCPALAAFTSVAAMLVTLSSVATIAAFALPPTVGIELVGMGTPAAVYATVSAVTVQLAGLTKQYVTGFLANNATSLATP